MTHHIRIVYGNAQVECRKLTQEDKWDPDVILLQVDLAASKDDGKHEDGRSMAMEPAHSEGDAVPIESGPEGSRGRQSPLVRRLHSASIDDRRTMMQQTIRGLVQEHSSIDIGLDEPVDEAGVDSMASVALFESLQHVLGPDTELPPTLLHEHPTVNAITDFVLTHAGLFEGGQTNLAKGSSDKSPPLPPPLHERIEAFNAKFCADRKNNPYFNARAYHGQPRTSVFVWQTVGLVLVLAVVALSAVPGAYAYDWLIGYAVSEQGGIEWNVDPSILPTDPWKTCGGAYGLLILVPAVAWMVTYTLVIVILKWVVVGRYRAGGLTLDSWGYMRWWFIEQCIRIWEAFVGGYVVGTPYIAVFYWLLGAQIPLWDMLYRVKTFVRGFDLVRCERGAELSGQLFGAHISSALMSLHGVWLDRICITTKPSKRTVLYPGFDESAAASTKTRESSESKRPPSAPAIEKFQRWTAPIVYLISIGMIMYLLQDALRITDASATVLSAYMLLLCQLGISIVLVGPRPWLCALLCVGMVPDRNSFMAFSCDESS